ncbi:MAG: MlaD family protein [Bacteroidota bacterium]|nr:MlaD family protein [Bacteroidota bacterium]
MKIYSSRKAVTVGVFIFIGLAIFIAGIFTLGGQKKTFEKKIEIRALFTDVGGLQEGNNVWFSGVKVGTVKKIDIIGSARVEVLMSIESKVHKFVKKDAKAKISSEGFIGNKIVVIYAGSPQSAMVEDNDLLTVESGLNTDEILATFQENNKNLLDITGDIKLLTEQLSSGKGTLGKLLMDESLMRNMQTAAIGLKQASANAQQLTANINSYTSRLQSEGSLTNDLITDTSIFRGMQATVLQLQQAAKTANEVTENIKLASSNIQEVSNNLKNAKSPVGVLLNDQQAGENLKTTLENLQLGTKKLDENMEALQHNFLLRGFFKKKARNEEKKSSEQ